MRLEDFEGKFLDYIDGTLSASERAEFESVLNTDAKAKRAFDAYREVIALEALVAGDIVPSTVDFSSKVLGRIAEEEDSSANGSSLGNYWRLFMDSVLAKRVTYGGVAGFAVLMLCLKLAIDTDPDVLTIKGASVSSVAIPEEGRKKEAEVAAKPVVPEVIAEAVSKLKQENNKLVLPVTPGNRAIEVDSNPRDSLSRLRQLELSGRIGDTAAGAAPLLQKQFTSGIEGWYYKPYPGCCDIPSSISTDNNTRSYNTYEENPLVQTAKESMSTFSIDVDTASYSQTRRALQEGRLPAPESIRIEEMLNYFNYAYPVQSTQPFTLSYEVAPSPLDNEKYLLKIGIKAKDVAPYEGGWNLVFLVDVSGSMASVDKLELVKKSLGILVDKMRPQDKVAIVTYAGSSGVALESTSATEKGKILSAIAGLGAGGSTNGAGGIIQAYEIAQRNYRKNAVNRVILATDGDFNVGVTSQDELIKLIEDKRQSGITLTTIGVGQDNLQDGTLEQLADKGNGNYFYLDTLKEARKVMEQDLTKNMEVIAKDVKLQIEFNPQHVKSYRLVGYDNRKLANKDFNNDKVDAGEIGAGHTVTALYELVLTGTEAAKREDLQYRYGTVAPAAESAPKVDEKLSPELAFLKIRYKEPEGTESKLLQYPITKSNVLSSEAITSEDFRFAAAVSYFGTILRESKFVGSYTLDDVAKLAQSSRGSDTDGTRQEFIELVKNAAVLQRR